MDNDVGVVFSVNSETSRWAGGRAFVPGQGQDGQKREPPFCHFCSCARVVSGGSSSSDVWETGLARDPNIIPSPFLGLALFSLANIGVTIFVQTSTKLMSESARHDPIGRTFTIMSTGAVLSEAHAIYGMVLTLLSGSILYGIGFTIVAWASLWWVWKRFKQNLPKLPNA